MIRIILPLAIIAAIFFGPMYHYPVNNPVSGEQELSSVTGNVFIEKAVACVRKLQIPIGEECTSTAKINGSTTASTVISGAATLGLVAAGLGVFGLLPFVGRLTSIVTVLAGLGAMGSMGYLATAMMETSEGLNGLDWGVYLTGGLGLLTLISGLSGMRGR